MMLPLVLLGRVLLSVGASTLQKQLTRREVGSAALWKATYAWMAVPACLILALTLARAPTSEFWWNAIAAGILDALGNLLMVAALRRTDLSVFGPLNGFRPVLALFFGWAFLREVPTILGGIGVGVTVIGAALLLRDEELSSANHNAWPMFGLRVAGLALSTFASVFLKRATLAGGPELTLAVWILCGLPVFLFWSWRQHESADEQRHFLTLHALTFFVMQWLTLYAFSATLLAYSFAFFQLGMVLQVVVGRWIFNEPQFRKRLACCAIICVGAALIAYAR
jgi:drug/metabolite transporter (DMT)-like permease